jgi:hypothetical protein
MSWFAIMYPVFILMFCLIGMVVGTATSFRKSVEACSGIESGVHPDLSPTNAYFQSGRAASDNSNLAVTNLRRLTSETLRPMIQAKLLGLVSETAKVTYFSLARSISGGLLSSGIVNRCLVPVVYLLMHRNEAADEEFAEVAYA